MTRPFRIALFALIILLLLPAGLLAWTFFFAPLWYRMTFDSNQAELILSRFGVSEVSAIEVDRVIMHTGQPALWIGGVEKFVVHLKTPLTIPRDRFMAEDYDDYWDASDKWQVPDSEWPWVVRGRELAQDCAESTSFGTEYLKLAPIPMDARLSFRRIYKNVGDANIEALIYAPREQTLTYVYCNY